MNLIRKEGAERTPTQHLKATQCGRRIWLNLIVRRGGGGRIWLRGRGVRIWLNLKVREGGARSLGLPSRLPGLETMNFQRAWSFLFRFGGSLAACCKAGPAKPPAEIVNCL